MFYFIDLRGGKLKLFVMVVLFLGAIYMIGSVLIRTFFFPIKYQDLVNQYAKVYQLDSYLVFSIIKSESKFDPLARSHKGAKGLMQITDQTGEWAAQEIGIEEYNHDKLYDPEINIRIGCWYMRRLLNQYNNLETSLAAYNAGSGNVSKWLKNDQYSKDGKTLVYIPFKETRVYVKNVINGIKRYRYFYKKYVE